MATQIITTDFDHSSAQEGSHETPDKYKKFLHPYLASPKAHGIDADYNIRKNLVMVKGDNETIGEKNGVKNYDAVVTSITRLGIEVAKALWAGDKPVTIGGDHSQGFATIKAVLLVEVLKAIKNDKIKCSEEARHKLLSAADEGKFDEAGKILDKLIEDKNISVRNIKNVTEKISVFWLDSHADFNDRYTTETGNFHGMSSAAACGEDCGGIENLFGKYIALKHSELYIICEKDVDEKEEELLRKRGVNFGYKVKTKDEPDAPTLKEVLSARIKEVEARGNKYIIELDVDLGEGVPETGTPMNLPKDHPNYRSNRHGKSPAGPNVWDTVEAIDGIVNRPNMVAGDISEIATEFTSVKNKIRMKGIKTIETGFKFVVAFVAGKDAIKPIKKAHLREGVREKFINEIMSSLKP